LRTLGTVLHPETRFTFEDFLSKRFPHSVFGGYKQKKFFVPFDQLPTLVSPFGVGRPNFCLLATKDRAARVWPQAVRDGLCVHNTCSCVMPKCGHDLGHFITTSYDVVLILSSNNSSPRNLCGTGTYIMKLGKHILSTTEYL